MEQRKKSKRDCCVAGCRNTYYNTGNRSVLFHRFPGKWYEVDRRQVWINSVRKIGKSKTEIWQPRAYHRVCSDHFVGGKISNTASSPAYNPTIFPKECMDTVNTDDDEYRGATNGSPGFASPERQADLIIIDQPSQSQSYQKDFSCQTDISSFEPISDNFLFECEFGSNNEVMLQVKIPYNTDNIPFSTFQADKCVGNDENVSCEGFHGYRSLKTDEQLNSLAGLLFDRFALLLSFLDTTHRNSKLSTQDKLLLFLMKMKLGMSFVALGVLFNLHSSTCCRIFASTLNELVQKTKHFIFWPDRNTINETMPKVFQLNYPKCRAIIDCTEIRIQQPSKVDQRIYTYSQYKGTFTAKILIAITPTGCISFLSKCYGGRSTDTFITNDCGFLDLLEPNDLILADKGFPGIKCQDNILLILPPFVHDGRLSLEEVEETYTCASLRVHVERSIQRFKTYLILRDVPYNLFPYLDDIVHMCGVLTNLQPPTMKNK